MRLAIIVCMFLAPAGTARAEPENALSLQIPSVFASGVAGEYERSVWTKFSVVGALGVRSGAAGDFDSRTIAVGAEARVWVREDWNRAGPYVGARLDVSRMSLTDSVADREVGQSWGIAESLHAGWRFTIKQRVEITPSAGIGYRHEFVEDGPLAANTRFAFLLGLTAGALF